MLFRSEALAGDEVFFHPHPLTAEHARTICGGPGRSRYWGLVTGDRVIGYGMLMDSDEGPRTPQLGIAIHPEYRSRGLGRLLMLFLHAAAVELGHDRVYLHVYRDNRSAYRLYESLGYEFEPCGDDGFHGSVSLRSAKHSS